MKLLQIRKHYLSKCPSSFGSELIGPFETWWRLGPLESPRDCQSCEGPWRFDYFCSSSAHSGLFWKLPLGFSLPAIPFLDWTSCSHPFQPAASIPSADWPACRSTADPTAVWPVESSLARRTKRCICRYSRTSRGSDATASDWTVWRPRNADSVPINGIQGTGQQTITLLSVNSWKWIN